MNYRFLITFLILLAGCKSDRNENINKTNNLASEKQSITDNNSFKSSFTLDSTVTKKGKFNSLFISSSKEIDTITALCTCKKDKKNNIIKVQLKTGIPTQKELDTLQKKNRKGNKIMQIGNIDNKDDVTGQFKFITFVLKDSIVKSINIYSKSTEKEYNGSDFDSLSIHKHQIFISTFNYSIASNVFGEFEFRLPRNFGYFQNDTILRGSFECYNWTISEKDAIKNWNIKEWLENRRNSRYNEN